MLIRVQSEKFHPTIARFYNIMARNGMIKPPPIDLAPGSLKVQYISPLLAAQRQIDALNMMRLAEALAPWAQADQSTLDNFDTDQIARILHAAQNADASILRSKGQLRDLRQRRAQANAAASQPETANQLSQAVKNVAQAQAAGA